MERVVDSQATSPCDVDQIGIAIHRDGMHIGVLHRVTAKEPAALLHLPWHNRLARDDPSNDYVLWVDPSVPMERAKAVAAFCRRIWKKNQAQGLPYGFSQPNPFFQHDGRILKGPARIGLTCATFVLAVFDRAGLPLIQYRTWPLPTKEDVARQKELAMRLEGDDSVSPDHAQAVRREIGNIRYRPLEVAGAGTADLLPSDHAYATRVARRIKRKLAEKRVPSR